MKNFLSNEQQSQTGEKIKLFYILCLHLFSYISISYKIIALHCYDLENIFGVSIF